MEREVFEQMKQMAINEALSASGKDAISRNVGMQIDKIIDLALILAAKQQAVPDGFVVVESEMSWQRADELSMSEWDRVKGLFLSQNRDLTAIQVEEFRLRWTKNKAHDLMRDYKAMIQESQK